MPLLLILNILIRINFVLGFLSFLVKGNLKKKQSVDIYTLIFVIFE